MEIRTQVIESVFDQPVTQITLVNDNHIEAQVLTLGATWQSFSIPTEKGRKQLLLGFEQPSTYLKNSLCAGQSIGRVAGRIDRGHVELSCGDYQLPQNNNGNCLHGGPEGFHKQHWDYQTYQQLDEVGVEMSYQAKEELDGFPGTCHIKVTFALTNQNAFRVTYHARNGEQETLFNPTIHPYFNLGDSQNLFNHVLELRADHVLELRDDLIPTGKWLPVEGTLYDFRKGDLLEKAIAAGGLDDAFVVRDGRGPIARLAEQVSGDRISIYSEGNGVVVYTMNVLDEGVCFDRDQGQVARLHQGVAIEAQTLPDAVHHQQFGDISLAPFAERSHTITFIYDKI